MHQNKIIPRIWTHWRLWLAAVILAGLAWRIIDYLLNYPFLKDEASVGLNILQKSYSQLTGPLDIDQVCPVGFLWLSKFALTVLGTNTLVLRFVPLLAGIGAVFLTWSTVKRFAGRNAALLATGLIACSLQTVRLSTDFKPYSLDLLIAMGYISLALWAIRRPSDWRPLLALILFTVPAIGFSYPCIFIAASVGLCLLPRMLLKVQWRQRFLWAAFCTITVVTFGVIFFAVTKAQMNFTRTAMQQFWRDSFPPHNLGIFWWIFQAIFSNMMSYPLGGGKGVSFLITPLCVLGAARLGVKRRFPELILLAGPFILTFGAAFFHIYPYGFQARVAQHLVPSIALLFSIGAVSLIAFAVRKRRSTALFKQIISGLCALLVIFALFCTIKDILQPPADFANSVNERHLIMSVFKNAGPGTQIVIEKEPYYFTESQWYLATQSHPFRADGQIDIDRLSQKNADLWVMNFDSTPNSDLGQHILQTLSEKGLPLHEAESLSIILYSPGEALIHGRAVHFIPNAPTTHKTGS
ncbi:MAG TPA: glycosyltransferase family 39 protein, partial [Phycisphaerae bacterium]|nr:glycosyltransferase family 39 protein [Phycisphaerae bacterium]